MLVRRDRMDGVGHWVIAHAKDEAGGCAVLIDHLQDSMAQASLSTLSGFNRDCFRPSEEYPIERVECDDPRREPHVIGEIMRIRFRTGSEAPQKLRSFSATFRDLLVNN